MPHPSSIGIASPWFGPLPVYARYFFQSAGYNDTVDFHVWSDQDRPALAPSNVHWHRTTLSDFVGRLEACLGFRIDVRGAFKLCDLKPTYGHCLAEELGAYTFWGVCDMDVLWGDLRAFLTEDWLGEIDLASFRGPRWLSGAFQLYRRDSAATRLFERAPGYREALASPQQTWFDEDAKRYSSEPRAVADLVRNGEVVSMTDVAVEAHDRAEVRLARPYWVREPNFQFQTLRYLQLNYEWNRGTLRNRLTDGAEAMFMHFVHMKKGDYYDFSALDPLPDHFFIRPFGPTEPTTAFSDVRTAWMLARHPTLAARALRAWHRS